MTTLNSEVVPEAGLEPARLAATDFESVVSTIPPLGPERTSSAGPASGQELLIRPPLDPDGALWSCQATSSYEFIA